MRRYNLDLKYHNLRLSFIRNRYIIAACMLLFLWAFSFVIGFLVLARIQAVIEEVQEGQKGNTCILLIKPSEITKKKAIDCIQKNRKKPVKDFHVNTQPNSSDTKPLPPEPTGSFEPIAPMRGSPTLTYVVVTKPATEPTIVPPAPVPSPLPTPQSVKTIEHNVDYLGRQICRWSGDINWQLGNCE